jgi:hypothetical protein
MTSIVSTRFNNSTWQQNLEYRAKMAAGCVYGSPQAIVSTIKKDGAVFVLEMNNDRNAIEGVGLIRNKPLTDKYYRVYNNGNYNRYVYKSKYHVTRDDLIRYNPLLVEAMDYILFKGKTHLKRGAGFLTVPEKLLKHERCRAMDVCAELRSIFLSVYRLDKSRVIEA